MNIDIANMALIIGEKTEGIDVWEIIVTFASVFAGAYAAYWFSMKLELRKANRQMRADFCTLSAEVELNLRELILYKQTVLDDLKNLYDDKTFVSKDYLTENIFPTINIDDLGKYVFLADYNRCFLSELKSVSSIQKLFQTTWQHHIEMASNYYYEIKKQNTAAAKVVQLSFERVYKTCIVLCIKLYYLNKHLCECYGRYINTSYAENMEKEYKNIPLDKELLEEVEKENWKNGDALFEKYWSKRLTFRERLKNFISKFLRKSKDK